MFRGMGGIHGLVLHRTGHPHGVRTIGQRFLGGSRRVIDSGTLEIIQATVHATLQQVRNGSVMIDVPEVMTRAEAMAFVRRKSDRAFGRWCKKWRVRSVSHGRYSRTQLNMALNKEARIRR